MAADTKSGVDIFDRFSERWPQKGDRLFSTGRDVFLPESKEERSYRLRLGYKRGGDILLESALLNRYDQQNIILLAIFGYRHYVELALKGIIEDYGPCVAISIKEKNHKLHDLWRTFIDVLSAFGHDCTVDNACVAVGECVAELSALDANSTVFRYPCNLAGVTEKLPGDGLNLYCLRDTMNGIENFFESVDADLSHRTNV